MMKSSFIRYDLASELLDPSDIFRNGEYRVLTVHGSFNQERACRFEEDFFYAQSTDQPVIPILISSYGGSVDQLNRMIDMIETSPVPVATIAKGACMSCGILLLAAGTKGYRWATRSSNLMLHDIEAGDINKTEDVLHGAKALKRYREHVFHRFDEHTGKDEGYWIKYMKEKGNVDIQLSANQAKRLKIIDHIGLPRLNVSVKVETSFE
jgi:ATP-dependent Clp protease protease subunit